MISNSFKIDDYRNLISQNSLKGDSYYIKFIHDPNLYLGIPILRSNLARDNDDFFDFNVYEPSDRQGVWQKALDQIEFIEKR